MVPRCRMIFGSCGEFRPSALNSPCQDSLGNGKCMNPIKIAKFIVLVDAETPRQEESPVSAINTNAAPSSGATTAADPGSITYNVPPPATAAQQDACSAAAIDRCVIDDPVSDVEVLAAESGSPVASSPPSASSLFDASSEFGSASFMSACATAAGYSATAVDPQLPDADTEGVLQQQSTPLMAEQGSTHQGVFHISTCCWTWQVAALLMMSLHSCMLPSSC